MAIGKNSLARAAGAARDQKVNSPSAAIARSRHPMLDLVSVTAVQHLPGDKKADVVPAGALVDSVKAHGIVEPLFIAGLPDSSLYLVSGHQRLAAAREAGLEAVPAVIHPVADVDAAVKLAEFVAPFATATLAAEAKTAPAPAETAKPVEEKAAPAPVEMPAPAETVEAHRPVIVSSICSSLPDHLL